MGLTLGESSRVESSPCYANLLTGETRVAVSRTRIIPREAGRLSVSSYASRTVSSLFLPLSLDSPLALGNLCARTYTSSLRSGK